MGDAAFRSMYANNGRVRKQRRKRPQTLGFEIGYPELVVKLAPTESDEIYSQLSVIIIESEGIYPQQLPRPLSLPNRSP
jgi:hypothetical protein